MDSSSQRYLRLTRLGQKAFSLGRLDRALRLFVAAEEEAARGGDAELKDRAFCNRCVVLLEIEQYEGVANELKRILMRSRDPFTQWMAAYSTSQIFEFEGNLSRALAYARRASELAQITGSPESLAASANQHGVLALLDSRFDEASTCLRDALQLDLESNNDPVNKAITRDNLGYCLMCSDELNEGMELCLEAAATLETLGARQALTEVYQDLCFGALQGGSASESLAYGERALALAREFNHPTVERNTLILLADAALDAGDDEASDAYLDRLTSHFPEFRGMKGFLRAVSVRGSINLKA